MPCFVHWSFLSGRKGKTPDEEPSAETPAGEPEEQGKQTGNQYRRIKLLSFQDHKL